MRTLEKVQKNVTKYWTSHNVTEHHNFLSEEDSLNFLDWRNKCYLYYEDLMPTNMATGKVVLDYGCGPGHDLVGFAINSTPKKLIAADVSPTSLNQARKRLELHEKSVELIELQSNITKIPLADQSVDLIHSSGVLHHTEKPLEILKEFKRILKPNGSLQIMIYNYESIWVHLYVAYELMLNDGSFKNNILRKLGLKKYPQNLEETFRETTDGALCPISRFYKREEFLSLLKDAGFKGSYRGASASLWMELNRLPRRFEAIADRRLPKEHRDFLYDLSFDAKGAPMYKGFSTGIGGCYQATLT
ncbi:MAG TPA: hypothetical protein DD412_00910 [Holosporales bacterium]|nr:hypothetical protein [Holosporales bacterium]